MQRLTSIEKKIIEKLDDKLYTVEFVEEWINRNDRVQINAVAALQAVSAKAFLQAVRCAIKAFGCILEEDRRIKIYPAPRTALQVMVSYEMIKDYRECAEKAEIIGEGKECDTCSWDHIRIGEICMCQFEEMQILLPEPYRPDPCHGCFGAANNDCDRCEKR